MRNLKLVNEKKSKNERRSLKPSLNIQTTKKVALYSRCSTDIQRDKGFTIPRQKEWLEVEAKKHGFKNFEHYVDDGYSSWAENRPEHKRMIEDIESDTISAVIVYKYDRLERNARKLMAFVELAKSKDIDFISISENVDTTTAMGKFFLTVNAGFAEMERGTVVERVRDAMWHKARKGDFCGGQPPYGYDIKDKNMIPNKKESKILKLIYDKFEELRSQRAVCQWLSQEGYLTKRGKLFAQSTLKRLLTNPIYKGYYTYGKRAGNSKVIHSEDKWITVKGHFKPIISEEQFDRVQVILNQREFKSFSVRGKNYLLTGLYKCAECDGAMSGYTYVKPNGMKYAYYRCHTHTSKGDVACSGQQHRQEIIDESVLQKIKEEIDMRFSSEEFLQTKKGSSKEKSKDRIKDLEKDIRKYESQQGKLVDLVEFTPPDLYKQKMAELIDKIDRLKLKQQELLKDIEPIAMKKKESIFRKVYDLQENLFSLPKSAQKEIVQQVVKRVFSSRNGEIKIELWTN